MWMSTIDAPPAQNRENVPLKVLPINFFRASDSNEKVRKGETTATKRSPSHLIVPHRDGQLGRLNQSLSSSQRRLGLQVLGRSMLLKKSLHSEDGDFSILSEGSVSRLATSGSTSDQIQSFIPSAKSAQKVLRYGETVNSLFCLGIADEEEKSITDVVVAANNTNMKNDLLSTEAYVMDCILRILAGDEYDEIRSSGPEERNIVHDWLFILGYASFQVFQNKILAATHDNVLDNTKSHTLGSESSKREKINLGHVSTPPTGKDLIKLHRRAVTLLPSSLPNDCNTYDVLVGASSRCETLLDVWLSYVRAQVDYGPNPTEDVRRTFRHMKNEGIGAKLSRFYIEAAAFEWNNCNYGEAKNILSQGLNQSAKPTDLLTHAFESKPISTLVDKIVLPKVPTYWLCRIHLACSPQQTRSPSTNQVRTTNTYSDSKSEKNEKIVLGVRTDSKIPRSKISTNNIIIPHKASSKKALVLKRSEKRLPLKPILQSSSFASSNADVIKYMEEPPDLPSNFSYDSEHDKRKHKEAALYSKNTFVLTKSTPMEETYGSEVLCHGSDSPTSDSQEPKILLKSSTLRRRSQKKASKLLSSKNPKNALLSSKKEKGLLFGGAVLSPDGDPSKMENQSCPRPLLNDDSNEIKNVMRNKSNQVSDELKKIEGSFDRFIKEPKSNTSEHKSEIKSSKISKQDLSYMLSWNPTRRKPNNESDSNRKSSPNFIKTLDVPDTQKSVGDKLTPPPKKQDLGSKDKEIQYYEDLPSEQKKPSDHSSAIFPNLDVPIENLNPARDIKKSSDCGINQHSEKTSEAKNLRKVESENSKLVSSAFEDKNRPCLEKKTQEKNHCPSYESKNLNERNCDRSSFSSEGTSQNDGIHSSFVPLAKVKNIVHVNSEPYAKLGVIGKGGSCKVYRVLSKDFRVLALKRVKIAGMDEKSIQSYANEISLLRRLGGNPSIINMYDSEVDRAGKSIYLVMELGEVDLNYVLQQHSKSGDQNIAFGNGDTLNMNFIKLTWQQMLHAVDSIHEERIIHSDLKPANFLFVRGALKLIDFGIAKAIQNDDTTNIYRDSQVGTLNYMSPEAILDTGEGEEKARMRIGRASDIWSLGCILYQMVYGRTPFAHLQMLQKMQAIVNPNYKIKFPNTADDAAIDAMRLCLQRDPAQRPPIISQDETEKGLLSHHRFLH